MEIEEIITKSIEKLNKDIDLRNALYLNTIHKNIDALVENANKWFNDQAPTEFIEILNSLINLSVVFADRAMDSTELITEQKYREFDPIDILEDIQYDFSELHLYSAFLLENIIPVTIITSKDVLRDSLYHIYFCLSQFAEESSVCKTSLETKSGSHLIKIHFSDLSDNLPDIRTLLRLFFVYDSGKNSNEFADRKIRVGLKHCC
jgi:hypothetical protein